MPLDFSQWGKTAVHRRVLFLWLLLHFLWIRSLNSSSACSSCLWLGYLLKAAAASFAAVALETKDSCFQRSGCGPVATAHRPPRWHPVGSWGLFTAAIFPFPSCSAGAPRWPSSDRRREHTRATGKAAPRKRSYELVENIVACMTRSSRLEMSYNEL